MSEFLSFHCPHCGKPLRVPLERIPPGGATGVCHGCQRKILIHPDGVSAPPAETKAPPTVRDAFPSAAEAFAAEEPAPAPPAPEDTPFAVKTPAGVTEELTEEQVVQRIQTGRILPWDRLSERGGSFAPIMEHIELGPHFQSLEPTFDRACWRHRRVARFVCSQCGRGYCEQCLPPAESRARSRMCPACEGLLQAGDPRWGEKPFWERVDEILVYPVKDMSWATTAGIALLLWIGSWGWVGWVFPLIALAYLVRIILRSAKGEKKLGKAPDLSDARELAASGGMALLVTAIVFLPLILFNVFVVYGSLNQGESAGALALLNLPLGLATFAYYPMALGIAAVWRDKGEALQPKVVLGHIVTIKEDYAFLLAAWFFLIAVQWVVGTVLGWIPLLGGLLASLVSAYAVVIEAHVLGWTLYMNAPQLGWK
jgi:hypothetical protein